MRLAARVRDPTLRAALAEAARRLEAELVEPGLEAGALEALRGRPDALVVQAELAEDLPELAVEARRHGAGLVVACRNPAECRAAALAGADEWVLLPAQPGELETRILAARQRAEAVVLPREVATLAELVRTREWFHDKLTGSPTLPAIVSQVQDLLERRGELTVLYVHFPWYARAERLYGWQRVDRLVESAAAAARELFQREAPGAARLVLAFALDEDLIVLLEQPGPAERATLRIEALARRLEGAIRARIEEEHGTELAPLAAARVGSATLARDPKVRPERLIYRAVRDAERAARSADLWDRARRIAELRATLRDGAITIEYDPIVVTQTGTVYGYEALARGLRPELRSPQVLLELAAEADLVWELGRLLRRRAIEGSRDRLAAGQHLFLNVDPHDFEDPAFQNLDPAAFDIPDPSRVVLEITERVAIRDYARFLQHVAAFRKRGFRFAVDDAGSGYGGLGAITNLAPDYIKLDLSLISGIEENFLKQNLVQTLVTFADAHGSQVVAEGVETEEELEVVRGLGVHLSQGFLFRRPEYAAA